jgi:hypothetical protein
VIVSHAAFEASINELIKADMDSSKGSNHEDSFRVLLYGYIGPLSKIDKLLSLKGKKFDKSGCVWNDIKLLNSFRNRLIHFMPEWDHEQGENYNLSERLKRRVKLNPFMQGEMRFPHSFLSYDSAKWALLTVMNFGAQYAAETGAEDRFSLVPGAIELP